jgi:hypothetical protein
MNDDEKVNSLDEPESISDNSAAPAGDDSFSAGEFDLEITPTRHEKCSMFQTMNAKTIMTMKSS